MVLTRATGSKPIAIFEDATASSCLSEHVSIPPVLRERKKNKHYSKLDVNLLRTMTVYKDQLNRVYKGPARADRPTTQRGVDAFVRVKEAASRRIRNGRARVADLIESGDLDHDPRADNHRK